MGVQKVLTAGVTVLAVAVVAGCAGGGTGSSSRPTGIVHGTITMTGGPRGASPVSGAGRVIAKKSGKHVAQQDVAEGQQFSFQLPAGKYQLVR